MEFISACARAPTAEHNGLAPGAFASCPLSSTELMGILIEYVGGQRRLAVANGLEQPFVLCDDALTLAELVHHHVGDQRRSASAVARDMT
jgi:hypothetical protein